MRNILLSPIPASRRHAWIFLTMIIVWHALMLLAACALVHWWVGFRAAVNGEPVPGPFPVVRLLPALGAILAAGLMLDGGLAWLAFWISTRRRSPGFAVFAVLWWRTCIPATILLPAACLAVTVWSPDSDWPMAVPLLWFVMAPAGPALLARLHGLHSFPPGHCFCCGYNLTGNASGTCPECGGAGESAR